MLERLIFLDTETTGLYFNKGDKLLEIACVEVINRRLPGKTWHKFIDPQCEISSEAIKIHGITKERLLQENARPFAEIADDFLNFISNNNDKNIIKNTTLVIHNAQFDLGFLNNELALANRQNLNTYKVVDSLILAKKIRPGKKNNLDALCDSYNIDRSKRTQHGALIDTELLAEVYLAMTRKQNELIADTPKSLTENNEIYNYDFSQFANKIILATPEELVAHNENIRNINNAIWNT